MGIIPLEKLIEYKGNRYELTRAMIDLAKSGGVLLSAETKYRGGKYIQTVIKNILDGSIKYAYEESSTMVLDEHAPFKNQNVEYDGDIYVLQVEPEDTESEDATPVVNAEPVVSTSSETVPPPKEVKRTYKKKLPPVAASTEE